MAKFCSNCGNEINDTDKHCSSCGAKVNTITLDSITDFIDEKKDRLEKRINSDFIEPTMNAELKEHVKDRGITHINPLCHIDFEVLLIISLEKMAD